MNVYLFDIDGTIMLSGGAGARAMKRVFREQFDIHDAFKNFQFQGKVDPAIFREALIMHGIGGDHDAQIVTMITLYEKYIAEEMPRSQNPVLYPGVVELIRRMAARDDISIGLLTGNVIGGARAKLSRFGLWDFFPYGAFGSDSEDRPALVPIALARASRHLGQVVAPGKHVYIIGDTDRDIFAAQQHGCTAVGVGTLNFSAAELAAFGATIVFEDLSDTTHVLTSLGVTNG